ncbi:hypothetical protein NA644_04545 [Pseudomonas stutzeri]|uniref:hypothetical protein n=1 Tax=Stutzerimonas stutzeri TaxID=316 RepID=UPI000415F4F3|nr:hypothetical protein [Stutzerimonas stutzeri]MCQ4248574.1 hypothetical protein [Stutzerimonas stutzeri]
MTIPSYSFSHYHIPDAYRLGSACSSESLDGHPAAVVGQSYRMDVTLRAYG